MAFYFVIFAILFLLSFIEIAGLKKKDAVKVFLFFSFSFYILSFIRWEVGTDWDSYIFYFDNISYWNQGSEYEWGFARINEFIKLNFNNYTILLLTLGGILFYFQSKAILEFSPFPIFSLFFLWAIIFGNIMFVRQWVAIAILFYSVIYIQQRCFAKFLIFVFIASLFHRSSFIFILAWWIYSLKWKVSTLVILLCISIALTVFVAKMMELLGSLFSGVIEAKLKVYLSDSSTTFGTEASLLTIIIKGIANKLLIFFAAILLLKKIPSSEQEKFRGYLNLYWFGAILYFSTISISVVFIRLTHPFDIFQIILIPFLFKSPYLKGKPILFVMLSSYLAIRLYIALTTNYYDLYVPFKTILF